MNRVVIAETLRRHLTSIAYCSFLAFVAIVALGVSRFQRPGAGWPWLVAKLAIVIGSVPIGSEFSSGTLQLILVKPVKRWVYLLSRVAGVMSAVVLAAAVSALFEFGGRLLWSDVLASGTIASAFMNCLTESLLAIALLVLLGSLTRAYFNVAIYLGVFVSLSAFEMVLGLIRAGRGGLGQFLAMHPSIEQAVIKTSSWLYPDPPAGFDGRWLALLTVEASVALVLAAMFFHRREVPYGAD